MFSPRARLSILAAATAFLAFAVPAHAAPRVSVAIDHAERLQLARPAGSVIVGNPAVADITVVDGRTLFISGRGYGVSQVIVLDPLGRTVWQGDVVVTAPTEGEVSVYRGAQATEMACSTFCAPTTRSVAKAAAAGGGSGSSSGGSSGGAINPALPAPAGAPQIALKSPS